MLTRRIHKIKTTSLFRVCVHASPLIYSILRFRSTNELGLVKKVRCLETKFCVSSHFMSRLGKCSDSCCPRGTGGWVFLGPPKPSPISRDDLQRAKTLWSFDSPTESPIVTVGDPEPGPSNDFPRVWPVLVNGVRTDVSVNRSVPSMRLLQLDQTLLLLHVPSDVFFHLVPKVEYSDGTPAGSMEDVSCIVERVTSYRSLKLAS